MSQSTPRFDFLPEFLPGWVWLAGAGPGDPSLLTLGVHDALGQADVIVHDALVGGQILRFARAGVLLEYVGKRGGRPSCRQADITERMIALARSGKRVLRLKGGDPFMFGRGGEEAQELARAGIPFRVLPGVTAGIGGLAYGGVPATHRDVNSAITFLTGHDAGGAVPDKLDWGAIARGAPVLVIYMGVKHLDAIATRLMAGGRPGSEPVAVISDATLPSQQVIETTLSAAAAAVAAAGLHAPAMIVVGEVVRLRAELDWLGRFVLPAAAERQIVG
ncbi:uroporphyrinogen-III C-methyltransferase [Oleomonas cavernae]|uniref:uroporphyrinogen-III C-methyltransferase n=1 Tax=Oleomonas cavernae TaxID=2320859 RepID=A0A418W991_9PROT|nr:uroporphyrinogen-III C-methyltransferase [Oleomonas cavernae]RJF86590.1 uroporphyrinogen-III C-methyltransferase [Oleomonas cavernae]